MIDASDKRAFDRRTRLAQREPSEALKRGLGHPSRAGCNVRLFAARSRASLIRGHLADADRTNRPDALAPCVTRVVYPASESTISMGPGDFLVESEVSPSLVSLEQLIHLLDGEAVDTSQSSPKSQLTNVFRGAHRLQVVSVSETGETQSQSTEHAVYFIRPTVNR